MAEAARARYRRHGTLIAGEGRYRAAQLLGLAKVPVIVLAGLSPARRRALARLRFGSMSQASLSSVCVPPIFHDTKERMARDGTEPLLSTPEEYAADIDREEIKWSAVVKQSGAKGE